MTFSTISDVPLQQRSVGLLAAGIVGLLSCIAVGMFVAGASVSRGDVPLPVVLSLLAGVCGVACLAVCCIAAVAEKGNLKTAGIVVSVVATLLIVLQMLAAAPGMAWGFAGGLMALLIGVAHYAVHSNPVNIVFSSFLRAPEPQSPSPRFEPQLSILKEPIEELSERIEKELRIASLPVDEEIAEHEVQEVAGGIEFDEGPVITTDDDTTFWMTRKTIREDGFTGISIEGSTRIEMSAGQKTATIHLPLSPALPSVPEIECDLGDAEGLRVKVGEARRYGVRFDLRRATADDDVIADFSFSMFAADEF